MWLVFYHQACQNILGVQLQWQEREKHFRGCSWAICGNAVIFVQGSERHLLLADVLLSQAGRKWPFWQQVSLCCETRQHLLLDETQATGKGSLCAKRLLQTPGTALPFLYIQIIWQSSVELIFYYLCFGLFLHMARNWWILRTFIMGRTKWAKHC